MFYVKVEWTLDRRSALWRNLNSALSNLSHLRTAELVVVGYPGGGVEFSYTPAGEIKFCTTPFGGA